jgi:hypothetical protein
MFVLRGLRRLYQKGRSTLIRWKRQKEDQPISGLPPGLSFGSLNDVCLLQTGRPLKQAWYVPLSRWKSTCSTYRLVVKPARGRRWNLIYKDAFYRRNQPNALDGLPVYPGPPEYLVYANARGPLARFLPTVYLFHQALEGEHYQYLLEDLGDTYRKNSRPEGILNAGEVLPAMHEAMRLWVKAIDQKDLLRYDTAFSRGLLEYTKKTLARYCAQATAPALIQFCERWPEIIEMYGRLEAGSFPSPTPVHGDFNITNILFHKQDPGRIKILDWEWAGLGLPYADLASLLNSADFELEEKVLANYCAQVNDCPPQEHRQIYLWCKLQRGLLDASFTALHVLEQPARPGFDRSRFIEKSLQRALSAFEALRI